MRVLLANPLETSFVLFAVSFFEISASPDKKGGNPSPSEANNFFYPPATQPTFRNRLSFISQLGNSGELGESRSYYSSVPAFIPAFDPISVLASLAFLAFLLQSFAALFDRTRSFIPTIISSRRSSATDYNGQLAEIEDKVLRALDEYASLSNDLLGHENEKQDSGA